MERPLRSRPRLLLLTPDYPPDHGGIQLVAHRLAEGLRGFETRVVALDSPGAQAYDAGERPAVRRVRANTRTRKVRNGQLNAAALLEAVRFRPEAIISAHIATSPAAALIRRCSKAVTLQYYHAMEIPVRPGLAAFAARHADDAVVVSRYTSGLLAATGPLPAHTHVIPPGVDLPSSSSAGPSEPRPTFLTVARLADRYKGHDVIVKALPLIRAKVPDVHWVVIGEGPLRGELEALAASYDLDAAVSFLGTLDDDERDGWLRRAHALAMPSRLPGGRPGGEGFGIAYMEAAAYGRPVVAGNVGGALDAVIDGETGLLVDPSDHVAVADAIATLLLDPAFAQRLGEAGARRAQGFAWPLICARIEAVLMGRLGLDPAADCEPPSEADSQATNAA